MRRVIWLLLLLCLGGGALADATGAGCSSTPTRDPIHGRPLVVGPEGRLYLDYGQRLVRLGNVRRPAPRSVTANTLTIVADDFVVDVWVNGKQVPLDARKLLVEIHGATSERIHMDLYPGDWIVFHVVANRLRWNGASYFGVHATTPDGRQAFVSRVDDAWSACDDPAAVGAFIAERRAGLAGPVAAPAHAWHDAPRIWRDVLGADFPGEPVWGRAPSTWIKYVVGPAPAPAPEPAWTPDEPCHPRPPVPRPCPPPGSPPPPPPFPR